MAKKPVKKQPPKPRRKPAKRKPPKKRTPNGLTIKQERFCHVYMETGNASEAYRQAYSCGRMKPETVNRTAHALKENPKIATRIHELKEELKLTYDIKKERLLYELESINNSVITDYIEIKDVIEVCEDPLTGESVRVNKATLSFKDFSKLTDQQVRAIEGIKHGKYGIELKLHGKNWSIDRTNKLLGHEAPKKLNIEGDGLGVVVLESRKDG